MINDGAYDGTSTFTAPADGIYDFVVGVSYAGYNVSNGDFAIFETVFTIMNNPTSFQQRIVIVQNTSTIVPFNPIIGCQTVNMRVNLSAGEQVRVQVTSSLSISGTWEYLGYFIGNRI